MFSQHSHSIKTYIWVATMKKKSEKPMHTILVVDDDPKLLKMLKRTLAYESLNVLTACNDEQARPVMASQKPDLLILDWAMPGTDSARLVHHLHDGWEKTPVLMLTAHNTFGNHVEGLECGADDYLVKPFAPAELLAHVYAMLQKIDLITQKDVSPLLGSGLDPGAHSAGSILGLD